ncbi:MAG: SDR family NAD(P)-dependent oxidoreductase [Nevskiales bacterium]
MAARIENKTIIITGASSGIGEAGAKKLAAEGAKLCLVARRLDELERVKKEIEAAGGTAWIYPADLSNETEVDAVIQQILAEHPQIDVLINNAGRSIRRTVKDSLQRFHDYQRTMQLNYFAAVRLTLAVLPRMFEQKQGHIINVSSMSALMPTPYYSAYVGSKSALDGFSRCLASELVDRGVHVTVINFPLVKTPMTAPTKAYRYLRQMDVNDAGDWIVKAVKKRPARITSGLGNAWALSTTVAPGTTADWTGRLFREFGKRLTRRAEKEDSSAASD